MASTGRPPGGRDKSRPNSVYSNASNISYLSDATTISQTSLENAENNQDDLESIEEENIEEETEEEMESLDPTNGVVAEAAERDAISHILTADLGSPEVDDIYNLINNLKDTLKDARAVNEEIEEPGLLKVLAPEPAAAPPKDFQLCLSTEKGPREKVEVRVRVGFLKMGEIQTAKEKYTCDVYLSAKWQDPALDEVPLKDLVNLEQEFFSKLWNPQLFLENTWGAPKIRMWYEVWTSQQGVRYIHEQRLIHSVWSETLELWDFPFDTQDLSVTVGSGRRSREVILTEDKSLPSVIVRDHFIDVQEWYLHDHVEVSFNTIDHWYIDPPFTQPFMTFTTRVSRRLGHYYWHAYFCLLLIIFMTFTSFAVRNNPPDYRPYPPESGYERRLRLSYLLMLTSVSYKFYIGENLPRVSYFTRLDYYIFFSIFFNGIISIWHGAIYWFEFCEESIINQHFFHRGARPPEGLAPGRGNASNCPYPISLLQERYIIAGCFGILFVYNMYYFLAAHINVRCRYRQMLREDKLYQLNITALVRKGVIRSRMEIFKFPDNKL